MPRARNSKARLRSQLTAVKAGRAYRRVTRIPVEKSAARLERAKRRLAQILSEKRRIAAPTVVTPKKTPRSQKAKSIKRRIHRPGSEQAQNRRQTAIRKRQKGVRRRLTQNREKTARKSKRRTRKKAVRISSGNRRENGMLLRRQRHFILEKLVGKSDKDAAVAAGYSIWIATNTKQKIWARPGVREEFERLKAEIVEVYYDRLRTAINKTPTPVASGACNTPALDSAPSPA